MTAPATDTTTDTTAADAAVAASTEATGTAASADAPGEQAATSAAVVPPKTTLTGEPAPAETATEPTPVAYDLKLPENAAIDASTIERTTAFARESGLSNEVAQKSLDFLNAEISSRESAYLESTQPGGAEWTRRVTEFEEMALRDPQIGGSPEKLKANALEAQKVLKEYAPPEVGEFLHNTGFGSHPGVLKFLLKVAKATSDGRIIQATSQTTPSKDDPKIMYDHPTSQSRSNT